MLNKRIKVEFREGWDNLKMGIIEDAETDKLHVRMGKFAKRLLRS